MHHEMMKGGQHHDQPHCRHNLLAPAFTQFGIGTAMGTDGKLYLVQLFAGNSYHDDNKQPREQTRDDTATSMRQISG